MPEKKINHLAFLLFFVFGGAIVGETVSLTMVITTLGSEVLSNLFLINGLLLLLLPIVFFKKIDRINRGVLLSNQLLISAGLLCVYLLIMVGAGVKENGNTAIAALVFIIYPISYLSKTILFLTFWTLANDVYATNEAKKGFPIVAAWGFFGGLSGACLARILLEKFDTEMIIGVWICAYFCGFILTKRITQQFSRVLMYKEDTSQYTEKPNIFLNFEAVVDTRLIRIISILYFFVFIAIFIQDFIFWKKSSLVFTTAKRLASFQFTYYLIHGLLTIIGLRFFMPRIIHRFGFTRIFGALPVVLLGSSIVLLLLTIAKVEMRILFFVFIVVQAIRYIVFETGFSPIYQMFFAAIPKEKRGRAKTFLEGIIKPSSIIVSGIILIFIGNYPTMLTAIIACLAIIMIILVMQLRRIYIEALIPHFVSIDGSEDIISKIGSHGDLKIVSLIREYSQSSSADIRSLAIKILSYDGTKQAFSIIRDIYNREQNQTVKEIVARSLKNYTFNECKTFVDQLLNDQNPRIRANAIFSINRMSCPWKEQLYPVIRSLFFENNPRIQIESAQFLWKYGTADDKKDVNSLIGSLCLAKNPNKRSAGLYLIGILKPKGWEQVLLENLHNAPMQVFKKSVEVIFEYSSQETLTAIFTKFEGMSRKHIAAVGTILKSGGKSPITSALLYLRSCKSQRLSVEILRALRTTHYLSGKRAGNWMIDSQTMQVLTQWALKDLQQAYHDCFLWFHFYQQNFQKSAGTWNAIVEDALYDQLLRLCERVLDVLSVIENEDVASALNNEFDLYDIIQRQSLSEILENCSDSSISTLVIPLLRNDGLEDLAIIGKSHFGFELQESNIALSALLQTHNKWICFCSLYVWYKQHDIGPIDAAAQDTLHKMQNDSNGYISRAAKEIAATMNKQNSNNVEPFELLERVLSLKKTVLFRHIPAERLMGLAEIIESLTYKSGTLISREGEISDHLYIIKEGSLKILKIKNNVKTQLSILGPGETYGEIGLFNQAPRSASALAHGNCILWVVQRSALKKYLLDMPEIAYNFLEIFSEKLRRSSEEVAQLISETKRDYL